MTLEEVQQNIETDCFFIDLLYSFLIIKESNSTIKINRFLFCIFDFILFGCILGYIPVTLEVLLPIALGYIILWILHYLCDAYIKTDNRSRYTNMKLAVARSYFQKLENFDNMEDWVKDKVFKDDIVPCAGIEIKKDEDK